MSKPIIEVEHVSKCYRIGAMREPYLSLREELVKKTRHLSSAFSRAFHKGQDGPSGSETDFWALKDVSFSVQEGEAIGIIGRNGAGKSTLLKILSQITPPTKGQITMRGRVASLLEVGTGFHPELTGRENIFLNGAILGMRREEIKRKFDEIVAFAEIDKFLDTPVKRYSSGMYVRLAFAVAAHLEPEILIVDEVLAVGDTQFQKKCLGKMGDVVNEGRTVLFVSHNMAAVQQFCQNGMVLNEGKLIFRGAIRDAIRSYINDLKTTVIGTDLANRMDRKGSKWLKFTKVVIYDSEGNELRQVMNGQNVLIKLHYKSEREMRNVPVLVSFNIRNSQGYLLANLNSVDSGHSLLDIYSEGYFECRWSKFNLRSGSYDCNLFCSVNGEIVDWMQTAFIINVEDGDYYKTGKLISRDQGDVLIAYSWACGAK
jgi:lipopolysaccharide transport system ATP-binding protein